MTESLTAVAAEPQALEAQLRDGAWAVSASTARRAGVTVHLVTSQVDAHRAAELFARVWRTPDGHGAVTPELAWALAHAGNYVAVAERATRVVGASLAFRAVDAEGAHLHSHLAGVDSALQCAGVGHALKLHQRAWAIDGGLDRVTWTFDPLVTRNCYFNLMKLGAEIARFYPNFYGPLSDSLNDGDDSDRCLVVWRVGSARARAAGEATLAPIEPDDLLASGHQAILWRGEGEKPERPAGSVAGSSLLMQLPPDIVRLRVEQPQLARAWRVALRAVLDQAFDAGYALTGASRDGWYVLSLR